MRSICVLSVRRLVRALVAAGAVGVVLTLAGVRTPLQTLLLLLFLTLARPWPSLGCCAAQTCSRDFSWQPPRLSSSTVWSPR